MDSIPQIGFLFLTRGELNNPDIWIQYFKNVDTNKYRLFIHPKDPKSLRSPLWSKNTTILNPIATNWGTISIVKATLILLNSANNNPYIKKFILVSESCIPTCSFDKLYEEIMCHNLSYISYNFSLNIDRLKIINNTSNLNLTNNLWAKQSQWMILDKKHVHIIFLNNIKNTLYLNCFQYCPAADEHYFINFLIHICKCDQKTIINRKSTFVDWSTKSPHPRTFQYFDRNLMDYCKKNEFFFARKFERLNLSKSDLDYLLDINEIPSSITTQLFSKTKNSKPDDITLKNDEIPLKPDEIPLKPDEIPLKPDEIPLKPLEIPLKPLEIPLKPLEIPLKPDDKEVLVKESKITKNQRFTPRQTDILIELNSHNILNLSESKINLIYNILFSDNYNYKKDKETQTDDLFYTPLEVTIQSREEPIKSPKEPIEFREEPIKSPKEPIKSPKEPIEFREEPIKSPKEAIESREEPIESPEEPIKSPKEAIESREEPIEFPEETSTVLLESSAVLEEPIESREEPIESREEPIKSPKEAIESREEPIKSPKKAIEFPEETSAVLVESSAVLEEPIESPEEPIESREETSTVLLESSAVLEEPIESPEEPIESREENSAVLEESSEFREENNEDLKLYKERIIEINRELLKHFETYKL